MVINIEGDHGRFRQIVRGRIKENLRRYVTRGEMIVPKGKDSVSVSLPQVSLPRFRFGNDDEQGTGMGEGEVGDALGQGEEPGGPGQAGASVYAIRYRGCFLIFSYRPQGEWNLHSAQGGGHHGWKFLGKVCNGKDGEDGADGADGADGTDGERGRNGDSIIGSIGPQGPEGPAGADGLSADLCGNIDGTQTYANEKPHPSGAPRMVSFNRRGQLVCVTQAWINEFGLKPTTVLKTKVIKQVKRVTVVKTIKCKCAKPAPIKPKQGVSKVQTSDPKDPAIVAGKGVRANG